MTMLLFPSDTAIDSYEVLSRRRTVDHLSIDGLVVGALWNGGHGKRGCGMVWGGGGGGVLERQGGCISSHNTTCEYNLYIRM